MTANLLLNIVIGARSTRVLRAQIPQKITCVVSTRGSGIPSDSFTVAVEFGSTLFDSDVERRDRADARTSFPRITNF